jgi:ACS family tartrate transporter-like MFS transporter
MMDDTLMERAVMKRVTARIVPFLMLCYFVAFLDRVNVGFAGAEMRHDLNLSATVFGFGAGVFFLAYFIFEVPSNLLMERFGARRWLARIMVTWGMVAAAMALVTGEWSFYSLRALLGLAEAGFFPGVILYLTYWFPRAYRARVVGIFMVAIPVSTFLGSPVSGAILDVNGFLGLHGWQWLFILEAVPAILLGVMVLIWLPDRPKHAKWLEPAQREWLETKLEAERRVSDAGPKQSIWQIVTHKRVMALALIYAGSVATNYGLSFWQPQMIKAFGMDNFHAGLINAIPFFVGSIAMILWGRRSDRVGERVWHTAAALFVSAAGLAACLWITALVPTVIALSVALIGCYALKGPFWALSTEFLAAGSAAAGIAQINAIGNLAGFVGPFLLGWIKDMTGSYTLGMLPMILLAVIGGIVVLAMGRTAPHPAPMPAPAMR